MADQRARGISWTDQTWNPVRGCTRVSEGCRNCYAEKVAHRFSGKGQPYEGLTNAQGRWNGAIRVVDAHMLDPLRWQRPRKVFVNSMSDLFHEAVSDETIDRIFAVMALASKHAFQVLTKRPERMRAYFERTTRHLIAVQAAKITGKYDGATGSCDRAVCNATWPLPNVWLGVSIEDQATADARIPLLLQTPAAVRFISAEPLLGPVDLGEYGWLTGCDACCNGDRCPGPPECQRFDRRTCPVCKGTARGHNLDWVIVGGESGPGARLCREEWIASIVAQCREAGVAMFVKQLGQVYVSRSNPTHFRGKTKRDDPAEWPEDLRVQEFPCS